MIIESLKVRILRALKSVPAAGKESPTKPGVVSVHADAAGSDDAYFFDAREAGAEAEGEPFGAWELVDPEDSRAAATAKAPEEEEQAEETEDPLPEFTARSPSGGADADDAVVLYTTTLRGVRRTFEDCNRVRALLECLGVAFRERDVSMDRGLRDELRVRLAGKKEEDSAVAAVVPPRLFVRGRDLGGAARVLALHEEGRLVPLLLPPTETKHQQQQREHGNNKCPACGGLRFVVCGECDGSRKVFDGDVAARCRRCNENGLVMCPLCS